MMTLLFGGVGFLGHAVRTGKPVEHYDVAKAQRWKREMEQALHPNGTDLEAVADFNELHLDEYILGDVAVEVSRVQLRFKELL
jgi:NAD dependent epimerase/dehydratase family enzyme